MKNDWPTGWDTYPKMRYYVTRKEANAPVTLWRTFQQKSAAQAEAAKMQQQEPQHRWKVVHSLKIVQLMEAMGR
jgi:hypothetical protein